MALKLPIALYSTGIKQIQPGDMTPADSLAAVAEQKASDADSVAERGQSLARKAESQGILDNSIADHAESEAKRGLSVGRRSESLAKRAESQGSLDNSIADHAESEAKRGLSVARRVDSYSHTYSGQTAYSFAVIADSQADLALGRASEATSMADRAASLARNAVEVSDISEASSLARRGNSVGRYGISVARRAESQGILDNSIADHAESEAKRSLSIARRDELRASEATSIATRAESIGRSGSYDVYTIAGSIAGRSRRGRAVYMTTTANTIALANSTTEATMPVIGFIIEDNNTSCKVKSDYGILTNIKVDSTANIAVGDIIYPSALESGKVSNIMPTLGVFQILGKAKTAESVANIDLVYAEGPIVSM